MKKKLEIIAKFGQNLYRLWKFFPKLWFLKISTKIDIFENFDQNWYFPMNWTGINIYKNFNEKPDFSKILTKLKILPKMLTKIQIT